MDLTTLRNINNMNIKIIFHFSENINGIIGFQKNKQVNCVEKEKTFMFLEK